MTDVVVRHCVVRVVRRGGWAWGATPHGLVDRVIGALPQLIDGYLDGLGVSDGDAEITEPVRITVRVPAGELPQPWRLPGNLLPARTIAGPSARPPADPGQVARPGQRAGGAAAGGGLPADPAAAFTWTDEAAAKNRGTGSAGAPVPGEPVSRLVRADRQDALPRHTSQPRLAEPVEPTAVRLLRYLARLHQRGELDSLLALLPVSTLELWCDTLNPGPASRGGAPGTADLPLVSRLLRAADNQALTATIRAMFAVSSESRPYEPGSSAATDHPRQADLGTAVAADDSRPVRHDIEQPPTEEQIRRALQALAKLAADADAETMSRLAGCSPGAPIHATPAGTAPRRNVTIEVDIKSALPFLLLGPLHQIGYLDAIPAALDGAGLADSAHLLATALAYSVLAPAGPGWRRAPSDQIAAAAFAGLPEPVSEPALVNFARQAGPALAVLNAVLARSLTAGHTSGQPLLLTAVPPGNGGGLILADGEGAFPIVWIDRPGQVAGAWRASSSPLVLVGSSAATPDILTVLATAGIRFVVQVPPTRLEPWRRLAPYRLWTNDEASTVQQLAALALTLPAPIDRLDEVISKLAGERPAVPIAASTLLTRGLTLAAAVSLGTIAWRLWKDRESPDPVLALERFGDLSARVRIEAERVHVRLPLGRRQADLREHGFLADIADVPWLAGRVVEFTGG
jgi:hypothetical protein